MISTFFSTPKCFHTRAWAIAGSMVLLACARALLPPHASRAIEPAIAPTQVRKHIRALKELEITVPPLRCFMVSLAAPELIDFMRSAIGPVERAAPTGRYATGTRSGRRMIFFWIAYCASWALL